MPDTAAECKLTWSSSNKKVATIDSNGIIGARKGRATITVKAPNGRSACVKIQVKWCDRSDHWGSASISGRCA